MGYIAKDVYKRVVPAIEGLEGSLLYYATEAELCNENYSGRVYGVRVEKRVEEELHDVIEYSDITNVYDEIITLTEVLAKNTVTPISLDYILDDYLGT